MKIVYNNILPFSGYKCINLFGILFVKSGKIVDSQTVQHESIHSKQQAELGWLGFYLWYALEYLIIRLLRWTCQGCAYRNVSFEEEAYYGEDLEGYLESRKHYAWFKYLGLRSYQSVESYGSLTDASDTTKTEGLISMTHTGATKTLKELISSCSVTGSVPDINGPYLRTLTVEYPSTTDDTTVWKGLVYFRLNGKPKQISWILTRIDDDIATFELE